jgi:hypothetical protein
MRPWLMHVVCVARCELRSVHKCYCLRNLRESIHQLGALKRCTGARCMLHRRLLLRCIAGAEPPAVHPPCRSLYGVLAWALRDWAKGGLCGGREAVRCARAQQQGGNVLAMANGTALFDAVAISGTGLEGMVRGAVARRWECCRCAVGRVSADGVRGRLQQVWVNLLCAERRRRCG